MINVQITTFNKVTCTPTWDNVPLKPTMTSGNYSASDAKTAIDEVIDNLSLMQPGEVINISCVVGN